MLDIPGAPTSNNDVLPATHHPNSLTAEDSNSFWVSHLHIMPAQPAANHRKSPQTGVTKACGPKADKFTIVTKASHDPSCWDRHSYFLRSDLVNASLGFEYLLAVLTMILRTLPVVLEGLPPRSRDMIPNTPWTTSVFARKECQAL